MGTLYQYFGDKNEIFDALILRERQRILGIIEREPFDANEPLQDGLERFFRIIFRSMPLGPELFRRLEHVPDALLRRRVSEIKKYVIALVRAQLEVHRAEIRVDDLDLAAFLIVNACEGIGINASGELWNERLTDELASLFARYLRGG